MNWKQIRPSLWHRYASGQQTPEATVVGTDEDTWNLACQNCWRGPGRTGRKPYAGPFLSAEAAMEACDKHFTSGHELVTLYEGRVWTTEQYFSLEPAKIIHQFCRQTGRMKADCPVFNFGVTSADRVAFAQWLKDNPAIEQRWTQLARDFSPGLFGQAANYWVNAYEKPASE